MSLADACAKTGHGPKPPPGSNSDVCRILKASGITGIIPGGAFLGVLNSCVYGKCFSHFDDAGQQKCALAHAGTLVVKRLGSATAARKAVKKLLATHVFRRIGIGADLAAIATNPSGGLIAMAVGRKFATFDLAATSDHHDARPTWHNTHALTNTARKIVKHL
jgi:hypothetical protein